MIGILLCFVSSSLGSLILTDPGRPGFGELSDYYALAFIIAMVYLAIQYPFSIFLGGVKGRIVAMVFYFILFFCAFSTDIMSHILSLYAKFLPVSPHGHQPSSLLHLLYHCFVPL